MRKQEFLTQLRKALSGLPQEDVAERLAFYSEMIDDRMEEGLSEEEAVSAAGSADEIAKQAAAEIPLGKIAKERIKPKRRLTAFEIVLLVLGSPVWLSLLAAAFAAIFSIYVSLWSVIVSLWAAFGALAACGFGGTIAGIVLAVAAEGFSGLAMLAAGLVCAGLSVFVFCICKAATKGILLLTKKFALWLKNCLIKKEDA